MVRLGRASAAAAAGLVLAALAGCAPIEEDGGTGGAQARHTLTVFAAASLTGVFEELGARFERDHPSTRVKFNFAGSWDLANQIGEGAPADVFASADSRTMAAVAEDGRTAEEPAVFVRNTLRIAVPADNPAGVESLSDLADPAVKVALCAEEAPCGAAAAEALDAAGLHVTPVSRERDVKAALTKTGLGEVDAALVYRTDVRASGEVTGIAFPEAEQAANDYSIAPLTGSEQAGAARAWTELVLSDESAEVFDDAGFDAV